MNIKRIFGTVLTLLATTTFSIKLIFNTISQ